MRKKIFIVVGAILILIVIAIIQISTFYPILFQLLFNREIQLKKEDSNINILLLGTGGGQHEGPDLTDTIIFASINPVKNKVVLVSVPRDLWIAELNEKINTAYAVGNSKKKEGGIILIRAIVSRILNQPIDYVVKIDFDGFVRAVDLIGTLDINVERGFNDFQYPIYGKENDTCGHKEEELQALATASSQLEVFPCRYKSIRFDKGLQQMNGETALQFVRSRHATGEEGTDFARNKRQEKAIIAFKDKLLNIETLLNPVKLIGLYSTLKDSIDTNIKQEEIDDFVKLAQKMKNANVQSAILDYGDKEKKRQGLLINPPISKNYDNQWVLIPRIGDGNFSEIQKYVECEIKIGNCPID